MPPRQTSGLPAGTPHRRGRCAARRPHGSARRMPRWEPRSPRRVEAPHTACTTPGVRAPRAARLPLEPTPGVDRPAAHSRPSCTPHPGTPSTPRVPRRWSSSPYRPAVACPRRQRGRCGGAGRDHGASPPLCQHERRRAGRVHRRRRATGRHPGECYEVRCCHTH
jgi:hypothetical protein